MENTLGILSLIFLVATVILGFLKKMNIGLLALGVAIILGKIGGMSDKEIYAGFDAKLFAQLVGVTYLFGIAQVNGTLELLAKKAVAMVGKRTYLVPIILFLVSGILTAMGPGNISIGALMTVVAITIAVYMGQSPILYALAAKAGANAFAISPITPVGIIGTTLGEQAGFSGFEMPVFYNLVMWGVWCFILFVIVFGRKKKDENQEVKILRKEDLEKLNKNQIITIFGMIGMVLMVLGFGVDVGLASFFIAAILSLIGISEEKKALSKVPWGTLMLICGVGVLMNIVNQLGGIEILTQGLLSIMNENTAAPIISISSSLLSMVSSTSGVVMPTMIPTLPGIIQEFGTSVSFVELMSCIMTGSFASAFSPASTGGGLILAAYASASSNGDSEEEQNKVFGQLFAISIGVLLINALFAWLGLYGIIG